MFLDPPATLYQYFSGVAAHPIWSLITAFLAQSFVRNKTPIIKDRICTALETLKALHGEVCDFIAACHRRHCRLKVELAENRQRLGP